MNLTKILFGLVCRVNLLGKNKILSTKKMNRVINAQGFIRVFERASSILPRRGMTFNVVLLSCGNAGPLL